jgi:CBS domain containing-hemolysin-like protein
MIAAPAADAGWIVWPIVLVLCAAVDSLYCGMETGIYVMNKIRLDLHAEAGSRAARFLQRMLRNSSNMLAVLLIGTNLARYLATFSIASMFAMAGAGENAELYTILVATPLLFVVGDAVPKNVFQRLAGKGVYAVVWLLRASNVLFKVTLLSPLVLALSSGLLRLTGTRRRARASLGHEGIGAVVAEGHASGVLTHSQSVMAERVMNIADVSLADVMVPMRHVVHVPRSVDRETLRELYRKHDYSRIVLVDEARSVAGVLDIYDALTSESGAPADAMTPPLRLDSDMGVTDALYEMQRGHAVMAVVQDDSARDTGIVTIKDLVEEIVGEIKAW